MINRRDENDIRWLLARIKELEAGLAEYGRHTRTQAKRCGFYNDGTDVDCDCGLVDLIDGNPPGTMQAALADGERSDHA